MLCCCLSSATLLLACVVRLLQGLPTVYSDMETLRAGT